MTLRNTTTVGRFLWLIPLSGTHCSKTFEIRNVLRTLYTRSVAAENILLSVGTSMSIAFAVFRRMRDINFLFTLDLIHRIAYAVT